MENESCDGWPDDQTLPSLPLLRDLNAEELRRAQGVLHRKAVPAGMVLMSEDQPGEIVYLIAQGTVRICTRREDSDIIIGLRGAGDVLGEMSVLDGRSRSATVITQTDCLFFWVSYADFWGVLWEIKPIPFNLATLMAQRIRVLTAHIEAMTTLSVPSRLARQVALIANEHGCPVAAEGAPRALEIPFHLTQNDLAKMIGATRVQVNQVFRSWMRSGLIEMRDHHLVVLDEAALRARVS